MPALGSVEVTLLALLLCGFLLTPPIVLLLILKELRRLREHVRNLERALQRGHERPE